MASSLTIQFTSLQQYIGWIMIIYVVFGNIGNLCNCLVFLQKQLRLNSCSCYLLAGSIANIFVLTFLVSTNIFAIEQFDLTNDSLFFCKFRGYIGHVIIMFSRTLIVLACFDRACISSSKTSMRALGTVKVALRIIFFCCVIWILISSHALIWTTVANGKCVKSTLYNTIFGIYVFIIVGVAPPLFMTIFSVVTLRNIRFVHNRVHPTVALNKMRRRDFQLTRMLVAEVVVYVLSTLPFPFQAFYSSVTISTSKSADRLAIEGFISFITTTFLIYINPSSTFFVYYATSKTFRFEFKSALKKIWYYIWRRHQHHQFSIESTRTVINRF